MLKGTAAVIGFVFLLLLTNALPSPSPSPPLELEVLESVPSAPEGWIQVSQY